MKLPVISAASDDNAQIQSICDWMNKAASMIEALSGNEIAERSKYHIYESTSENDKLNLINLSATRVISEPLAYVSRKQEVEIKKTYVIGPGGVFFNEDGIIPEIRALTGLDLYYRLEDGTIHKFASGYADSTKTLTYTTSDVVASSILKGTYYGLRDSGVLDKFVVTKNSGETGYNAAQHGIWSSDSVAIVSTATIKFIGKTIIGKVLGSRVTAVKNLAAGSYAISVNGHADTLIVPFASTDVGYVAIHAGYYLSRKHADGSIPETAYIDGTETVSLISEPLVNGTIYIPVKRTKGTLYNGTYTVELADGTVDTVIVSGYPQSSYTYGSSGAAVTDTYVYELSQFTTGDDGTVSLGFDAPEITTSRKMKCLASGMNEGLNVVYIRPYYAPTGAVIIGCGALGLMRIYEDVE